jgi:hypothetical protein
MRPTARARTERALELLISGRPRAEVARELGIRPQSLSRLLSRPEAQAELSRLRTERMRALADQVSEAALQAVGVLKQVAEDPLAPAPVRVGAAGRLVELALKLFELMDLAGRIERLEAEVAGLKGPA